MFLEEQRRGVKLNRVTHESQVPAMVCLKMLRVGKWAVMVVKSLSPFGLQLFGAIGEGP